MNTEIEFNTDSNNKIDISIIVPIYNVEEYLEECLNSLANQTKDNIEIIMVDDGSTDSSAEIAKKFEKEYSNFFLYQKENGGLGNARNYGVKYAKGKYIAFVDSDDKVTRNMYELMYNLAEKNKSDLTICNVVRFNSKGISASQLHKHIFKDGIQSNTHITKLPELIYDTTAWNKLILKEFWDKHKFKYPEKILYEDIPVTIPMHYFANNVSIVREAGYFWRVRDGVNKSITQNAGEMRNLEDRITVLKMVDDFFETNNLNMYKKAFYYKVLETDLMIFINKCRSIEESMSLEFFVVIREYINEKIDKSIFNELSIIDQQKYEYIFCNNLSGLLSVLEFQWPKYYNAFVNEENGKFYVKLPDDIFTIENRDITQELKNIDPFKTVNDIKFEEEKITILGNLYIPRVNIYKCEEQEIRAFLYNEKFDYKRELDTRSYNTPEFSEQCGFVFNKETGESIQYNYNGTGFEITINVKEIDIDSLSEGDYKILIEYKNRLSDGCTFIKKMNNGIKKNVTDRVFIKNDSVLRTTFTGFGNFIIKISKKNVFCSNLYFTKNEVICELETDNQNIYAVDKSNENKIQFYTEDNKVFKSSLKNFEKIKEYSLYSLTNDGIQVPVMQRKRKYKISSKHGFIGLVIPAKSQLVKFAVMKTVTRLDEINVNENTAIIETTTLVDSDKIMKAQEIQLCVENKYFKKMETLAKVSASEFDSKEMKCKFIIDFSNKKVIKNFYEGYKDIFISYKIGKKTILQKIYYEKYFKFRFLLNTLQVELFRSNEGFLRLHCIQMWPEAEKTANKRKNLIYEKYPEFLKEPINNKRIVFSSMWGRKYSCNPQHLYEYIDKYYPDYECIWVFEDQYRPIHGKAKRVRLGSQEYYYYMSTAKYLVNNVNFSEDYIKRKGQIEIQTMHGTPLKTLGLDVVADFPTEKVKEKYLMKTARWDYLIAQGRFVKDKAYSMFRFNKKVLKTGYPRTDYLFNYTQCQVDKIKKRLGLPLNKKIILYTPTWRVSNKFDMEMDISKMKEALSDDYILLIRIHHLCGTNYHFETDNVFSYDVTTYDTIEELYLISDILITDYSSVMFDFALLNRPMIFYLYDFKEYSENLRGIYVDFSNEAPGPIVYDTNEIIDSITCIDKHYDNYKERIEKFKNKYLSYENGNSCKKIVKAVLKPKFSFRRRKLLNKKRKK